jgi:hypothetical protein
MRSAPQTQKTGTGFTLRRESIRDSANSFALLTQNDPLCRTLLSYLQETILRALKIRHHFIGEQFDPVPRPPGVASAGVEIESDLIDAEFVA